jgi:hypothetical protein
MDPIGAPMPVIASSQCGMQHTIVLCLFVYKNNTFHSIGTSSCVLASIANNKGTLNTLLPVPVSLSQDLFLALSLSLLLSS